MKHLTWSASRIFDEGNPPRQIGVEVRHGETYHRYYHHLQAVTSCRFPHEYTRELVYEYDPLPRLDDPAAEGH